MDEQETLLMCQERQKTILRKVAEICEKTSITYWLDGGTLLGAVRHNGFIPWDDDVDIAMPRKDFIEFQKIAPKYLNSAYFLQSYKTDHYYGRFILKIRDNKSTFVEVFEKGRKVPYNQGIYVDVFPVDLVKKTRIGFVKSYLRIAGRILTVNELSNHDSKYVIKKAFQESNVLFDVCEKGYLLLAHASSKTQSNYFLPYAHFYGMKDQRLLDYSDIYPLKKLGFCGENYNVPADYDKYLRAQYGDYWRLPKMEDRKSHHVSISFD